jgi:TatA/E family protein of Tat protein translocase
MPFQGAFSPSHIFIVGLVALLVLGPEQLPNLARQAGKGIREMRRVRQYLTSELRDVVADFDAHPIGSASAPDPSTADLSPSEPDAPTSS